MGDEDTYYGYNDGWYDDTVALDTVTVDTTPDPGGSDSGDTLDFWTNYDTTWDHFNDGVMGDWDWLFNQAFDESGNWISNPYPTTSNPVAPTNSPTPPVTPANPGTQANNSPRPTTTANPGSSGGGSGGGSSGGSSSASQVNDLIKSFGQMLASILKPQQPVVTPGTTPAASSGVSPAIILGGAALIAAALYFR